MTMTRREIVRLAALGGVAAAAPSWVTRVVDVAVAHTHAHAVVQAEWKPAILTPHQDRTVVALCELIIPKTDTAGATDAGVNRFVDAVIADADAPDRDAFLNGLGWIDRRAKELHGEDFVALTAEQQTAIVSRISGDAASAAPEGVAFFKSIKALTITGYYTSKAGMAQELGDDGRVVFPGYAGCTHPEHRVTT